MVLSKRTLSALTAANLTVATDIQAAAIPHALTGRDILGAAKTGSGKTLGKILSLVVFFPMHMHNFVHVMIFFVCQLL